MDIDQIFATGIMAAVISIVLTGILCVTFYNIHLDNKVSAEKTCAGKVILSQSSNSAMLLPLLGVCATIDQPDEV